MRIAKVLNNNIAIAQNDEGDDVVIVGRGVAFGKKRGDLVDEALVTRVFVQSPEEERRMMQFINEVPEEYVDAAVRVVESAKLRLGKEFEGNLYFTLADHLHYAVERARSGENMHNRLLLEIKMIYKEEFEAGLAACGYVSECFNVALTDDEAAFIALHFVNATLGVSMSDTYAIAEIVRDIYAVIRNCLAITIDEESLSWYRLMVHVKFFAQRMVMKGASQEMTRDDWLLEMTRKQYPASFSCATRVAAFLKKKYDHIVPDAELAYLAIHIEHVNHGACSDSSKSSETRGDDSHGDVR